jgi:hypothetical protein
MSPRGVRGSTKSAGGHRATVEAGTSSISGVSNGEHYGTWQAAAKDRVEAGRPSGRLTPMSSGFPEEAPQRPQEPPHAYSGAHDQVSAAGV